MQSINLRLPIFLVVCLLLTSCTQNTTDVQISITVPSLRENYPKLLKEAQQWRPDAYLHDVRIWLSPGRSDVISAGFYSSSHNFESLGVYFDQDGDIVSKVYSHDYKVLQITPITEDDWLIDSGEVLAYIDNSTLELINSGKYSCSAITLLRASPSEMHPLVWRVSVWDCRNFTKNINIDPNTGAILTLPEPILP